MHAIRVYTRVYTHAFPFHWRATCHRDEIAVSGRLSTFENKTSFVFRTGRCR